MFFKRAFDVAVSTLMLMAFSVPLAGIYLGLRLQIGAPVIFKQERLGQHGLPFTIYKFRSMRDLRDSEGRLLPDHLRTTRFSNILRRYALDELPQLWNILKGDMSLVGPRPRSQAAHNELSPEEKIILRVKPGLTGPYQLKTIGISAPLSVSFRNASEIEYASSPPNIKRDFLIVVGTIPVFFKGHWHMGRKPKDP